MLRVIAMALLLVPSAASGSGSPSAMRTQLVVPIVQQTPQRCGQAALEMVLQYYGAGHEAQTEAERAYDPILRGSLVTDLALAAQRAGFASRVATLTMDSLVVLLESGVPPILLYQNGRPPFTVAHYGVLTGWDPELAAFTLNEGRAAPRKISATDLARRWRTAGSLALIVQRVQP